MRHARLASAFAIGLLALIVVVTACRGGLVAVARCPHLLLPHCVLSASLYEVCWS